MRAYLDINGTTGAHSDALITSNIRAASAFLERATGRQFEAQTGVTKTFTTNGSAALRIPDLRSVTAVSQQGVTLDVNVTYWLMTDNRGVSTSIQFRAFGSGVGSSYLSNPQWFDRNLDQPWWRYGHTSLPNDLSITGNWGHDPLPQDLLHACKVLAAWYTKRPASVLANVAFTPDGNTLNYGDYPPEVLNFIKSWALGPMLVAV